MQNPGEFPEQNPRRVASPDVTSCNPFPFQSHCFAQPVVVGTNNNNNGENMGFLHLNGIAEVPQGFYEYIFGENGEIKIFCKICQYVSNKKSNFKRHFTNMHFIHHHDDKPLECCGIRFSTKGDKVLHTKSVHKFGYKCLICTKVFDRPALLQRHLAKHTGKKPYKCSLCAYQTPNKANAKRHIEKKHSDCESSIQGGAILFVNEDGEQVEMENASRSGNYKMEPSSTTGHMKTSTNCSSAPFSFQCKIEDLSTFKIPRFPPSATVTSSSFLSQGADVVDSSATAFYGADSSSHAKNRQISHSVDKLLNGTSRSQIAAQNVDSFIDSLLNPEATPKGNNTSLFSPESGSASHAATRQSGLLHQSFESPSSSSSSGAATATSPNQDSSISSLSPSYFLHQCVHGCWHWVVGNGGSDFSASYRGAYFLPRTPSADYSTLLSPDLRFPSSVSQQTENSSITSVKSEDDEDDEIDVEGDDDSEHDSICNGLMSCSTIQLKSQRCSNSNNNNNNQESNEEMNEEKKVGRIENQTAIDRPPVEQHILPPRRSSINESREDGVNEEFEENATAEEYIPKKLRMSKCRYNNNLTK